MQGWRKGFLARIPPVWSDLTKQILYNAEFRDFIAAPHARRTNLILLHKLVGIFSADAQHFLKGLDRYHGGVRLEHGQVGFYSAVRIPESP